jgi:hypothetical protein
MKWKFRTGAAMHSWLQEESNKNQIWFIGHRKNELSPNGFWLIISHILKDQLLSVFEANTGGYGV